jgi:ATP synthase protein I
MNGDGPSFDAKIGAQAARKLAAQRMGTQSVWLGLGMFGVIGWSVTVPTLLGALLGVWWDKHHPGPHSWTLALLIAGLTIGCANAGYWVARQNAAIHRDPRTDGNDR